MVIKRENIVVKEKTFDEEVRNKVYNTYDEVSWFFINFIFFNALLLFFVAPHIGPLAWVILAISLQVLSAFLTAQEYKWACLVTSPFVTAYYLIAYFVNSRKKNTTEISLLENEIGKFGTLLLNLINRKEELENNIETLDEHCRNFSDLPEIREIFLDERSSHKKLLEELNSEVEKSYRIYLSKSGQLSKYTSALTALQAISDVSKFSVVRTQIQKEVNELKSWNEVLSESNFSFENRIKVLGVNK